METKRFPIILNNHAVMVIHIFTRTDELEDMWMTDYVNNIEVQEQAAEQLISQLECYETPLFLRKLREAITKKLKEHDDEYGTKFA